jgi:molecular chaperone GrpE
MTKDNKKFDSESEADYNPDEEIVMEELSSDNALKKLRENLKKCVSEKQEYIDGWQRTKADFINYKKGQEERKIEILKFAKEDLISDILPILDSFNMAKNTPSWKDGMEQIYSQMISILSKNGLEEIMPLNDEFDPREHEAVEIVEGDEGKVVEVLQSGYKLNGKIIRAARVKIGNSKF